MDYYSSIKRSKIDIYAYINRPNIMRFLLCRVPRTFKFIGSKSRTEVTKDWKEGGMGHYCLMGTEFVLKMMKKFWV